MSSTEIVRHFRAALDCVIRNGDSIRIERHGETVAELRPLVDSTVQPNSTLLAERLGHFPPDPEFADTLEQLHSQGNRHSTRDPWQEARADG